MGVVDGAMSKYLSIAFHNLPRRRASGFWILDGKPGNLTVAAMIAIFGIRTGGRVLLFGVHRGV